MSCTQTARGKNGAAHKSDSTRQGKSRYARGSAAGAGDQSARRRSSASREERAAVQGVATQSSWLCCGRNRVDRPEEARFRTMTHDSLLGADARRACALSREPTLAWSPHPNRLRYTSAMTWQAREMRAPQRMMPCHQRGRMPRSRRRQTGSTYIAPRQFAII